MADHDPTKEDPTKKDTPVTIAEAERHGELCKVRQMQKPLEALSKDAKAKGITVEQELQNRGMKDITDFIESCDKFPVTCHVMDFAELGAGFPLYFQFLQFLGFMLLVFLVIQFPLMVQNMNSNKLNTWRSELTDDEVILCNTCTGDNQGVVGIGSTKTADDYGKSCKAHDIVACGSYTDDDLGGTDLGLWCCRSWCFVDEKCPIATASGEKKGLFYSYDTCPDNQAEVDNCLWQKDSGYEKAGLSEVPTSLIDKGPPLFGGVTPGNAGKPPEHGIDGGLHGIINFAALCVFCAGLAFQKARLRRTESAVDAETTMPNDYAIQISGLPTTATEETPIAEFWRKNAVKDKEVDIVKVVIGWNLEEFTRITDEVKRLNKVRVKLITKNGLPEDHPQVKSIVDEMKELRKQIVSAGPTMASKMSSTGICVVIFRTQADHRDCLARWTGFWPRWTKCEPGNCHGICKGGPLPRWKDGAGREVADISVSRADNPMDVNWVDLGRTTEERRKKFAHSYGIMIFLIGVAFGLIAILMVWEEDMKIEAKNAETGQRELKPNKALIIVPALLVSILNMVLNMSARMLSKREYHNSKSSEQASTILKMTSSLIFNTAGVTLILKSTDGTKGWYVENGLVDAVYYMLFINAIFPALLAKADIMGRIKVWVRTSKRMGPKMEKAPRKQGELFKKYWEPSEFDLTRRYANALQTFISCALYQPIMPQVMIWGFLGLVLQYWIDKYMLLNVHKRPESLEGGASTRFGVMIVRGYVTIGLPVSILLFLSPSTKDSGQGALVSFMLFGWAVAGVTAVVPDALQRWLLCAGLCFRRTKFDEEQDAASLDYYEAQMFWPTNMKYHKTHPLYQTLPEKINPENLTKGGGTVSSEEMRKNAGFDQKFDTVGADKPLVIGRGQVYTILGDHQKDSAVVASSSVLVPASSDTSADAFAKPAQPVAVATGVTVVAPEPVAVATGVTVVQPALPQPDDPQPAGQDRQNSTNTVATVSGYVPGQPVSGDDPQPAGQDTVATVSGYVPGEPVQGFVPGQVETPVWEFEAKHGYQAFDDDCQQYVEKIYQDFSSGKKGPNRRIKTRGKEIFLDFKDMESKVDGSDRKRKIRRRT